jgi:hypothetical protein
MSVNELADPFSSIAQIGPQDFELRGDSATVPLHFEPDAAFIMQCLLYKKSGVSAASISQLPGFEDACSVQSSRTHNRYYDPQVNHARGTLDALTFTFRALGSTFIETDRRRGSRTVYYRKHEYAVVDERPGEDQSI